MKRIELANEQGPTQPRNIFNLRRHEKPEQPINSEKIYLTLRVGNENSEEFYPVKIDGITGIVEIRKYIFQKFGFDVIIKGY